ncbi:hypothetical protein [Nocardioides limicola]|uniref:hypothetical protein n=1 Tax=Nocardioides limicola TaxID=2803368 RepID=UPI00193BBF14|nr:hypothetical protein [Nocardioides sp. DJM-14]
MTMLHEDLTALAERAPTSINDADLWHRGRRRMIAQRVGATVVATATVLVLALIGVGGFLAPSTPEPIAPRGEPVMPDHFHNAGKWLPGTDRAGWHGPLIAAWSTSRGGWLRSRPGIVGVSAVTGEYRFLDLPGRAVGPTVRDADFALSPEGGRVAYWTSGEPRVYVDEPDWVTVTGYAVVSTLDGRTLATEEFETEVGLAPEAMTWADEQTLIFEFAQLVIPDDDRLGRLGCCSTDREVMRRDLDSPVAQALPAGVSNSFWHRGNGRGQLIWTQGGADDSFRIAEPITDTVTSLGPSSLSSNSPWALSPNGTRAASTWGGPRGSLGGIPPVIVAELGEGESPARRVPGQWGDRYGHVLGWFDDEHVAFMDLWGGPFRDNDGSSPSELQRIHIDTGEVTRVIRMEQGGPGAAQFALGLLDAPLHEATAPPRPWGPRVSATLGAVGLVGLIGLLWLVRWRRRGRG